MPILDLYEHGEQKRNLAHFATLASLAAVDGEISAKSGQSKHAKSNQNKITIHTRVHVKGTRKPI